MLQRRYYDHYIIIVHPPVGRVLLLPSEAGWTAPDWVPDPQMYRSEAALLVNRLCRDRFNLRTALLKVLNGSQVQGNGRKVRAYFVERLDEGWVPPAGSRWTGPEEIDGLELAAPELKPLLKEWLDSLSAKEDESLAPPWTRPGWQNRVEEWVKTQLAARQITLAGLPDQLKSWAISALLRFPTDAGYYFFKAVPPMFKDEPRFTARLAGHFPNYIPQVVAVEAGQRWMLMPDFQAQSLAEIEPLEIWEAAARSFGDLQVASLGLAESLLAEGCRDRRLEKLAGQMEAVFGDTATLSPPGQPGLEPAEMEALHRLKPELAANIEKLAAWGLPAAIDHGDLNYNNIARRTDGGFIFYDWTDITVTHPFFSLEPLLIWSTPFSAAVPGWRERLRDAYLTAWTEFLPLERLKKAFELAYPLARLVQMLNYHWIAINVERSEQPKWRADFHDFARRLLKCPSWADFNLSEPAAE